MTTFTWTISQMDTQVSSGSYSDVVVTAHWTCAGVDGDYKAQIYSTCSFALPSEGTFTPYADLTQDQVLGWCWSSGVDKDATEAGVQGQIDYQMNPPVVVLPLPWVAPAAEAPVPAAPTAEV